MRVVNWVEVFGLKRLLKIAVTILSLIPIVLHAATLFHQQLVLVADALHLMSENALGSKAWISEFFITKTS